MNDLFGHLTLQNVMVFYRNREPYIVSPDLTMQMKHGNHSALYKKGLTAVDSSKPVNNNFLTYVKRNSPYAPSSKIFSLKFLARAEKDKKFYGDFKTNFFFRSILVKYYEYLKKETDDTLIFLKNSGHIKAEDVQDSKVLREAAVQKLMNDPEIRKEATVQLIKSHVRIHAQDLTDVLNESIEEKRKELKRTREEYESLSQRVTSLQEKEASLKKPHVEFEIIQRGEPIKFALKKAK